MALAALAVAFACATGVWRGAAWAQPVPVFAVTGQDDAAASAGAQGALVEQVTRAAGPNALSGPQLAREVAQRYAFAPPAGDPLAGARERVRAARSRWADAAAAGNAAAAEQALSEIDRAARELEATPEALDAREDNQRALLAALVFLAEQHENAGRAAAAQEAMARLARTNPGVAFSASAASPAVQQHYQRAVETMQRGALTVQSVPAGCTVTRDGRDVGTAPVELQDLSQGAHRIAAQCGAVRSLIHRVQVAGRARATVEIDAQLDAALAPDAGGGDGLRYATVAQGNERLAGDLARLGRALGARRAVGVIVPQRQATVVDVASGQVVGSAPVDDAARIEALLRQPVAPAQRRPGEGGREGGRTVVITRGGGGGGAVAGAVVLGVLGAALVGGGIYAVVWSGGANNRAQQQTDAAMRRDAETQRDVAQWSGVAGIAVGGVLAVTGVLIGVLTRGSSESVTVVHAQAAPLPGGGAVVGLGGAF